MRLLLLLLLVCFLGNMHTEEENSKTFLPVVLVSKSMLASRVSRLYARSAEDAGEERRGGLVGEPDDPLPGPVHSSHRAQTEHRTVKI